VADRGERLPTGRLIAHATMAFPITASQLPLATYLPAIYAREFGISLYVLGAIFLGERIWSTVADPLVGWLCDRTSSRFGRRKVWIAAGTVLFAATYAYLFFPPGDVSPTSLTLALALLFLGWSMIVVPYYAWSGELSPDYHERTRITTYQTVVTSISLLLVLALPALAENLRPGDHMLQLHAMGAAVIVPMIPACLLMLWSFPDHAGAAPARQDKPMGLGAMARTLLGETALLRIILADFFILFAAAARGGLFIFFAAAVLGMPKLAATLFLFQFVFGLFSAPLWQAISRRLGKTRAVLLTEIIQTVINFALLLVGTGDLTLFLVLALAQGLTQGTGNLILRAMLADAADEFRLRTGSDRTAVLFSLFSISAKAGSALPLGLALPLIAWFGFDPQLASQPQSALMALSLAFALGPGLAHLAAVFLVRGLDMDEARQVEIRRQLEARDCQAGNL
jgi:GPH family glycoside/pentoside/hexuronide:cation symporter